MLVVAPRGELRQVLHDLVRVGVEDVRTVFVHQDAGLVVVVEGVAGDVVALVDDEHALAHAVGETLCEHGPGQPGAHNKIVEPLLPRTVRTGADRWR